MCLLLLLPTTHTPPACLPAPLISSNPTQSLIHPPYPPLQINRLEETLQQLNDQLADSDIRQERLLKDKNAIIQMKDDEITELKSKMDDMAEEFGEMLRETLEKMRERIEVSSGSFAAPELPIQQRMEELKVSEP